MSENNNKLLCIYHGNCLDGFGAAWSVRHALGDNVEFYKGIHQQPPPDVLGRDVVLVDFSYSIKVMLELLRIADSVTILDHHISAHDELAGLLESDELKGLIDMDRSGAMIAWQWFNPELPAPRLIEHIQDRDLWRFELAGTREINSALSSYPFDFEVWDRLMAGGDELEALRRDGAAIERRLQQEVTALVESGVRRMTIAGYDVPVLNAPRAYVSDAGHIMAQGEPFAACYWDHPDGRSFSLRSSEQGVDVAEVAVRYGGGGHKHAAGFTVDIGWEGE
jgi:oligoribonuclease NrnB/cAMP/cGMP phosphodiesterase (DHH superfamily)